MNPRVLAAVTGRKHWGLEPWSWLGVLGWAFWFLWFVVWETLGMVRDNDQWPTLTNLTKRYVPGWALAMGVGWLLYHFVVQYTTKGTR